MTGAPVTSGSTVRRSRTNCGRARLLPDVHLGMDLDEEAAALADELAPELVRHVLDGHGAWGSGCAAGCRTCSRSPGRAGPAGSSARPPPTPRLLRREQALHRDRLVADHPDLGGQLGPRLGRDHVEAPLDVGERLLAAGRDPPGSSGRRGSAPPGGAKLLIMAIFSAWSSGITRRTESTSETDGSFSKALLLAPQLLEGVAEARALKPERPVRRRGCASPRPPTRCPWPAG